MSIPNVTVVDYETTGLSPYMGARPFVGGMETLDGKVSLCRPGTKEWEKFAKVIEDPKAEKCAHNAKFEIKMSKHMGLKPAGKFHDTMALSVLINEYQPINLDSLRKTYFKDDSKGEVQAWLKRNKRAFVQEYGREPNYSDVPPQIMDPYLEGDLDGTLKLFAMWHGHVAKFFPYLYNLETELAWHVTEMEDRGILIDRAYCENNIGKLRKVQHALEAEIYKAAGCKFNLASPKQLGQVLVMLGVAEQDENGKVDTSYDTLKLQMDRHPFIKALIKWRTLAKMVDTYLVPFTQKACGDVIHPSFWQYGKDKAIVTGRFSATDPNMQNIPKGIRGDKDALHELGDVVRRAVIPRPGYAFVFFDFKQIEAVIFTCGTGDEHLIRGLRAGEDCYDAHAKRLFGARVFDGLDKDARKKKRYDAKELFLSLIYGMGTRKFAMKVKKPMDEARRLKNQYFYEIPKAKQFIMKHQTNVLSQGYTKDIFGRKYHVPTAFAYKAINAYCQGTAATIMKRAILKSAQLRQLGAHPIITVHDELICEVPLNMVDEVAREGKKLFEEPDLLSAPIGVDVEVSYTNWAEKKPYVFKD